MHPEGSAKSRWWHDAGNRRILRNAARAAMAAVPVVLVNSTAFIGQFAFLQAHVHWILLGQVLIAVTIESIAVYLAWHAHMAQMANDSAARLKLGAYSFALLVGAMNYSHYAAHWHPTVMAVLMFFMSSLSPWLWGIHSRRASRDKLKERGLVEEHAVRLGANRWTWHPIRSFRVMYWATWHGVSEPKVAIGRFSGWYGTADTPVPVRVPRSARAARAARQDVPAVPAPAPVPEIEPAPVVPVQETVPVPPVPPQGDPVPPVPAPAASATVSATADLGAQATLSGGRPSRDVIDRVEMQLAATPIDQLPGERATARLLGDENQRRLARTLLKARREAEPDKDEAPPQESVDYQAASAHDNGYKTAPGMIASPARFQPGGSANG